MTDGISAKERIAINDYKDDRYDLGTALGYASWFLIGFASALAFVLVVALNA